MSDVKVYTVNGAVAGSSSSIPDWLTKSRSTKTKGKRALREHVEGQIELIQGFEFPEASNKIKTTRDGHHAIATGTYKPQMRVWDLDELTLKFERHGDAENVDFIVSESSRPPLFFLLFSLVEARNEDTSCSSTDDRYCRMTGQRRYTSKTTVRSSCTRKAASIIERASPVSVVLSHTTTHPAMPSFLPPETRYTVSISNKGVS